MHPFALFTALEQTFLFHQSICLAETAPLSLSPLNGAFYWRSHYVSETFSQDASFKSLCYTRAWMLCTGHTGQSFCKDCIQIKCCLREETDNKRMQREEAKLQTQDASLSGGLEHSDLPKGGKRQGSRGEIPPWNSPSRSAGLLGKTLQGSPPPPPPSKPIITPTQLWPRKPEC